MIDEASLMMANGKCIAIERIQGVNDNMVKSHYHEYYELYYLETGERYHMVNDKLYLISSGEFVIFPPYVMHHSYGEDNVSFKRIVLYFRADDIMVSEIRQVLTSSVGIYKSEGREGQWVHHLLNELLNEQNQSVHPDEMALRILLNHLLLKIARLTKRKDEVHKTNRITEVIHYIHQHYMENITLELLANEFYISQYYLCREFKRYTNSTIVQYINNVRVIHAQRMFLETNQNMTEISKSVGFSNVTHFNRVFKSITGMSPSKNRKQHITKGTVFTTANLE